MDVLELPRPVINFLRTMTKESCRYVLSWDIFGATDSVTLTLTWKLIDGESSLLTSRSSQEIQDFSTKNNHSILSSHRSRRDETSLIRTSRGKSLEGNNPMVDKQIAFSAQHHASSSERSSTINQQQNESEPIYANVCRIKYSTSPSSSSSLHKHLPASIPHRKDRASVPLVGKLVSKLARPSYSTHSTNDNNGDEDGTDDPWVKRFDNLLERTSSDTIEHTPQKTIEPIIAPGRVKSKKKPEYI